MNSLTTALAQKVTLEQLVDEYPKWAADIVRATGEIDACSEVICL